MGTVRYNSVVISHMTINGVLPKVTALIHNEVNLKCVQKSEYVITYNYKQYSIPLEINTHNFTIYFII